MCWQNIKRNFLNILYRSCELLVPLQLPSDCWVVSEQMNLKNKKSIIFCTNLPKNKKLPFVETSRDIDQKRMDFFICKYHVTMIKKDAYVSTKRYLPNQSLTFIHINKSLSSAANIVSRSPMAYNTTGQANVYRLSGLWQMPTQVWTIFLV